MKIWDEVSPKNDADQAFGFVGTILNISGGHAQVLFDDFDEILDYKVEDLKLIREVR